MMRLALRLSMVLAVLCALVILASAATAPSISINVEKSVPRQVEETTAKSVSRDYNAAWQSMTQALDQSRKDLLGAGFVGTAQEKLATQVEQQQKSGLHEHIVDKGHTVDVVFYSPEGSAMELHDTVRLQIEVMDGSKVIHSEDATVRYVALLTAAENSWKVRMLEMVPAF